VITSQGPWTPIAEPATSAAMLAGLLAIGFGRRRLKAAAPKY
jgi:hypothetical protein